VQFSVLSQCVCCAITIMLNVLFGSMDEEEHIYAKSYQRYPDLLKKDTIDNASDDEPQPASDEDDEAAEFHAYLRAQADKLSTSTGVPRPQAINNEPALNQKLDEIVLNEGKELPFLDHLQTAPPSLEVPNAQDDFDREAKFKNVVNECVKDAHRKFAVIGFEHRRPDDYYAEMVKSDSHMEKVRRLLLRDKNRIEESDRRRKQRDLKKFGKKVQVAKQQERQQKKKQDLDAVRKWRKQREKGNTADEFPVELDDNQEKPSKPLTGKRKVSFDNKQPSDNSNKRQKPPPSNKRSYKNQKFGFGGPKRYAKDNTADSAADLSSFSRQHNKTLPRDLKAKFGMRTPGFRKAAALGKGKKHAGPNRPGKRARQASRTKK